VALGLSFVLLRQVGAQAAQRCFGETGFCVSGSFRPIWEQGGLTIFGLPLGPQGAPAEPPPDPGLPAQVQWFERHRFELHPTNPAPYSVLLGRVGAERLAQLGRDWRAQPSATPQAGCRFFPETGRNLCTPFLAAWQANGVELDGRVGVSEAESLALFGLPLTEAQEESVEGQTYTVQWFERARFELHQDGGVDRMLFGRLGAELLAGGVSAGTLPVEEPSAPPAAPPAGGQPTAASPRSTATTAPRRPTATPDGAPAEPSSTSRPTEPATTRTPQPTNTAIVPTSTPRPPSSTPRPPTSTPTPNSFTDPPPTPPPGFPSDVGLPAQADTSGGAVANLDAATDSLRIGAPFCLGISSVPGGASEVTYTISGPNGDAAVRDQTTIFADNGNLVGQWRWAPGSDYIDGIYAITAAITDLNGSALLTETGSLALLDPAPGSGPLVTTVRLGSRISDSDVQECGAGAHGSPGDQFATYLTGYTPGEVVDLHLYSEAIYKGRLDTIVLDDQGKGGLIIFTKSDYPIDDYIVVTGAQALEIVRDPSYLQDTISGWEQRLGFK